MQSVSNRYQDYFSLGKRRKHVSRFTLAYLNKKNTQPPPKHCAVLVRETSDINDEYIMWSWVSGDVRSGSFVRSYHTGKIKRFVLVFYKVTIPLLMYIVRMIINGEFLSYNYFSIICSAQFYIRLSSIFSCFIIQILC